MTRPFPPGPSPGSAEFNHCVAFRSIAFRLSSDAVDALAEVRQLCELQLAGVSIETEKLKRLLDGSNIESLDLSGRTVDAEFVDTIAGAKSLKHLVLHDSQIDAQSLSRILDSNPSIYVDLGRIPEFADDELLADLRQRASNCQIQIQYGLETSVSGDRGC